MSSIPPLVLTFTVDAAPQQAFELWVSRADLWWPASHTVSQAPERISFGPGEGGEIVESAPDGASHVWGRIVAWDPPHRLAYSWHLFFDPADATDVEVTFAANGTSGSTVTLTHTGWDRLGDEGAPRRERNLSGWTAVTDGYRALVSALAEC